MAYTINPNLPQGQGPGGRTGQACWSKRKVARYLGFSHSAVAKWCKKAKK